MSDTFEATGRRIGHHFANTTVTMTAQEALALRNQVEEFLENYDWPLMQIEIEDIDGVKKAWTTCPHCKAVDSGIQEIDQCRRANSGEIVEVDKDGPVLQVSQEDPHQFRTLWFVCEACTMPVRLPEGVEVVWS